MKNLKPVKREKGTAIRRRSEKTGDKFTFDPTEPSRSHNWGKPRPNYGLAEDRLTDGECDGDDWQGN